MACFKLKFIYKTAHTCYIEAESRKDIDKFLEKNETWQPLDQAGLVELVDDLEEEDIQIREVDDVTALFRLDGAGHLVEVDE